MADKRKMLPCIAWCSSVSATVVPASGTKYNQNLSIVTVLTQGLTRLVHVQLGFLGSLMLVVYAGGAVIQGSLNMSNLFSVFCV